MADNFLADVLQRAVSDGLSFVLIGGNAVNAYGYLRTTLDIDLMVSDASVEAWKNWLKRHGYECIHQTGAFCQFRAFNNTGLPPLDLILVDPATFEKIRASQQFREVAGLSIPVPHPLHIIALKLHACRQPARARAGKDIMDILGLIEHCQIDTNSADFMEVLTRYADEATRSEIQRRLKSS